MAIKLDSEYWKIECGMMEGKSQCTWSTISFNSEMNLKRKWDSHFVQSHPNAELSQNARKEHFTKRMEQFKDGKKVEKESPQITKKVPTTKTVPAPPPAPDKKDLSPAQKNLRDVKNLARRFGKKLTAEEADACVSCIEEMFEEGVDATRKRRRSSSSSSPSEPPPKQQRVEEDLVQLVQNNPKIGDLTSDLMANHSLFTFNNLLVALDIMLHDKQPYTWFASPPQENRFLYEQMVVTMLFQRDVIVHFINIINVLKKNTLMMLIRELNVRSNPLVMPAEEVMQIRRSFDTIREKLIASKLIGEEDYWLRDETSLNFDLTTILESTLSNTTTSITKNDINFLNATPALYFAYMQYYDYYHSNLACEKCGLFYIDTNPGPKECPFCPELFPTL